MPSWRCSDSFQAAPTAHSTRPFDRWSTVTTSAASTAGYRCVMPVTIVPSRTLEVSRARPASSVQASRQGPRGSPYSAVKWSKTQTPSRPASSASRARDTSSSQVN